MPGIFLSAEWRELVMLSFEVDQDALRALVPRGTVLDSWNGKTFVSMVAFRFLKTRVRGVPVPFHRDFEEVNLRFYVRREHPEGPRRGVVFVKEIVPRAAIAWVARVVYDENYVALPMRHRVDPSSVRYEWRHRSEWHLLEAERSGEPETPADDSEETFITEHYWGYARQRDGSTLEYRVEHPRWRVWRATASRLEGDFTALYGDELARFLNGTPSSACIADGSAVVVRRGTPLRT